MTKPDITLEPTKVAVAQMAARIYAAYIVRGEVKEGDEAAWMERSIREAVRIAKTVEASVATEESAAGAPQQEETGAGPQASSTAEASERGPAEPAGGADPESAERASPGNAAEGRASKTPVDAAIEEALAQEEAPTYKTEE